MTKYRATFNGRLAGAIGIMSDFSVEVCANGEDAARLELYKTHDHITMLKLEPIQKSERDK